MRLSITDLFLSRVRIISKLCTLIRLGRNILILRKLIVYDLNALAPETIESFSVLKDATATALYGSRGYIQEKQVITVAVPEQFHPLVCLREKEMIHSGLVPDMLDKVTNFSGLRFEYVFTDSYTGALELVQQGQADMAGFYLDGENSALQMGLSLTKSYVTLDNLIVRNKFVSYPGAGLRCTVLDGRKLPNTVHADQGITVLL